jgi:hypothetical protein
MLSASDDAVSYAHCRTMRPPTRLLSVPVTDWGRPARVRAVGGRTRGCTRQQPNHPGAFVIEAPPNPIEGQAIMIVGDYT